jgi:RNA polymerase sigma-70 factor, ECF subfamily
VVRGSDNDIQTLPNVANLNSVDISSKTDFASFERLVREYQPYAFSLAMRFLCDETEATDVVQESFLRVWKNRNRYDPGQKFSTWLYKIVTNLCMDRFRSLKRSRKLFISREREVALEDLPDQRDWAVALSDEQLVDIIKTLSDDLSTKQRLVFTLRDLQDLSVEEVVDITGMSTGSVKSNLYFARKTIRDILARRFGLVRGDL